MADKVAQGVGPEFKPQYHKRKKKNPGIKLSACLSTLSN
jgi:hypothetical protein